MSEMPLNGKRLKRWLFPTPEERAAREAGEDLKRQERYTSEMARLDRELASLHRQESLAERRALIRKKQARVARLQTRAAPKQAGGLSFPDLEFKEPKFEFPDFDVMFGEKKRRR